MKKLVILFVACTLVNFSKAEDGKKVRVGLNGSGTVSWLKPNIDGNFGYERKGLKLGYTAGIVLDFMMFGSENYAFSTGLNLMQIGGKLNYPDISIEDTTSIANWTTTANYNLRYVDIPLTIKMKTNEIGYLTYFGQVGVGLGVNIKARQSRTQIKEGGDEYTPADQNENVAPAVSLFRIPLIVGFGAEYNLTGNTSVVFGLQFNNGFTNVFRKKSDANNVYELDDNGKILFDVSGAPKETDKKRNALTNFFALNVGLFF